MSISDWIADKEGKVKLFEQSQKQPKFKFGDKVRPIGSAMFGAAEIRSIKYGAKGYSYYIAGENFGLEYLEQELELYEEPKPKKLYAFAVDQGGWIYHNINEKLSDIFIGIYERAPEFDIEYPEKKNA